ncbi:P-loop containing nucleoside triphosphate hydrolase protein [Serendipita vermifera]|nr:P-loop containing nucleoside triphosphate hydrolase protein [Serendipita vermifera]
MSINRSHQLSKLFNDVIADKVKLAKRTYSPFLEAIFTHQDPPTCLDGLVNGQGGLAALQAAIRSDQSPAFFNDHVARLFNFLSAPELKRIAGGDTLKTVLNAIVDPPTFWQPFVEAIKGRKLNEDGKLGFSWLFYHLLLLLPFDEAKQFRTLVDDKVIMEELFSSPTLEVRNLAQQIKHIVSSSGQVHAEDPEEGPGGRHDNDFVDFRQISIVPTADEIHSNKPAFIRPSYIFQEENTEKARLQVYLENHFRLLREDMLYEIREELQLEKKRKQHRNAVIGKLRLVDAHRSPDIDDKGHRKRGKWSIVLQRQTGLGQLYKMKSKKERMHWLQDNRQFLKHQSVACLLLGEELVALVTIERDEKLLSLFPPKLVVQIEGAANISRALLKMRTAHDLTLVQVNAPIFAYEPILKALKRMRRLPLSREILYWKEGMRPDELDIMPLEVLNILKQNPSQNLKNLLNSPKEVILDASQSSSLLVGLTQSLSLIQGPPGTGKSFIGALLAKFLHDFAHVRILVVCYTNHALDQFLEDLLEIGIPGSSMVRLGGKSTPKTEKFSLQNVRQRTPGGYFTSSDWDIIHDWELEIEDLDSALRQASKIYSANISEDEIMDFLRLDDIDVEFSHAFQLPPSSNGERLVGRNGKPLHPTYLLFQWSKGKDAGVFKGHSFVKDAAHIWGLSKHARLEKLSLWKERILKKRIASIQELAAQFNEVQANLDAKWDERDGYVISQKRIIGCTTTAAAKYRKHINEGAPQVLLVEEAGEILESHILTAMSKATKKVILIGDHKQLRPKVNDYKLTVEKGEQYDLDRSLFERLILNGYPHLTLSKQHRMRPEISALVRHLTYPDLIDAPKTRGRENIRGIRDNVVFIHHTEPEDDLAELNHTEFTGNEATMKSSKRNKHEVEMVLKILRFLGQQGYRTDEIVILTPYLGQLRALQEALKHDNDPVLNDLDSADLVRAGLVTSATAKRTKNPIRLATIDNYQGEESKIVIASLTRSNAEKKIGFMASPQRVNVLLSRARDGLIMIGNAHTFLGARAKPGEEVWKKLFAFMREKGHVYDGLPTRCERHPKCEEILTTPNDFDQKSPDGGCMQPW